jgi:DNA-binding response OmpR family regulator
MNPLPRLGWRELAAHVPDPAHVLVVDDDPLTHSMVASTLGVAGHRVRTADSAEAADAWLAAEGFDLLVLDIGLPRMSGMEFLTWALTRDPELAVVMLTGVDDPEMALDCLAAGARSYLVKPLEPSILVHAVNDALALRRLLRERNRLAHGDTAPV